MRVLFHMPAEWAQSITASGEPGAESMEFVSAVTTQGVLETVSSNHIDLILIAARPEYLKQEILGTCDLFGIAIVALTDSPEDERYSEDCGLAQHISRHSSWNDVLEMAGLRLEAGDEIQAPSELFLEGVIQDEPQPATADITRSALVISVWGPTGAPGRTTIAIATASELARQGHQVLLIDADSYGGTVSLQLGLGFDTSGLASACRLAHKDALTREALEGLMEVPPAQGQKFWVLTGISDPSRWPELSESRMTTLLALARDWFEVIVIDVGFNLETDEEISSDLFAPRRNAATLTALRDSDAIVAVCGADNISVARFMRMHRELRERFPAHPLHAVVNRAQSKTQANEVREVLGRFGGIKPVAQCGEVSTEFSSQIAQLTSVLIPEGNPERKPASAKRVGSVIRRFAR